MIQENNGCAQHAYFLAFPMQGFPLMNLSQQFYPSESSNYFSVPIFPSVCASTSTSFPTFTTVAVQQDEVEPFSTS